MSTHSFFTMALELREIIYTLHLTTPDPPHPIVVNRKHRIGPLPSLDPHERWAPSRFNSWGERCNRYPDPRINRIAISPRSLPLLLCNKRVNEEVITVINFLYTYSKEKLRYEIDCEIFAERTIYPTWLLIPVRYRNVVIPCIHATFRISGQCWKSEWTGARRMLWSLLILLERFLENGPQFIVPMQSCFKNVQEELNTAETNPVAGRGIIGESDPKDFYDNLLESSTGKERPIISLPTDSDSKLAKSLTFVETSEVEVIRVDKLIIDVVSPIFEGKESFLDLASGWPYPFWPGHHSNGRGSLKGKIVHPEDVVRYMSKYMDHLFSSGGERTSAEDCAFLKPRLGCVHLLCDGEVRRVWRLNSGGSV